MAFSKYRIALGLSALAVAFGISALIFSSMMSLLLGLAATSALVAYTLGFSAKKDESSLLENWARSSRWGRPTNQRRWLTSSSYDESIGALNASVIGVEIDISIGIRFNPHIQAPNSIRGGLIISDGASVPAEYTLTYTLSLPCFEAKFSRYEWHLHLYRAGLNGETLLISGSRQNSIESFTPAIEPNSVFSPGTPTKPQIEYNGELKTLHIRGTAPLKEQHNIYATKLTLSYWPDAQDESAVAVITAQENRISQ